jgi:hypothetical protein
VYLSPTSIRQAHLFFEGKLIVLKDRANEEYYVYGWKIMVLLDVSTGSSCNNVFYRCPIISVIVTQRFSPPSSRPLVATPPARIA